MGSTASEISRDKADNKNFEKHDTSKNHSEGSSHLQEEAYQLLSWASKNAKEAANKILKAVGEIGTQDKEHNVALTNLSVMKEGPIARDKDQKMSQIVEQKLGSVNLVDMAAGKQTPAVVPSENRGMAEVAAKKADSQKEPKNFFTNLEIVGLGSSGLPTAPAPAAAK